MKIAYKTVWQFLLSISIVFLITFTVFPQVASDTKIAFLSSIKSESLRTSWTLLLFVSMYNIFGTLGRVLAG